MKYLAILLFSISLAAQTHIEAGNINGTYYADKYPGADIGAKVNYIYGSLCPTTGCAIIISQGNYQFSTPIVAATTNKPLVLKCDGATSTGPSILTYTPTTGTAITLASGLGSGIVGCNIQGPASVGSAVGLSISNTTLGTQTQSVIEKTGISNFNTCLQFGNNAYLVSFRDNAFYACQNVLSYPAGLTGSGEDIIFYGGLMQGIIGSYSATCVNVLSNAETIAFFGVSFDSCGITLNAAGINASFVHGNMENLASTTGLDFLTIGSACTQCSVLMDGINLAEDTAGTRSHIITNGANGSHLTINGGRYFTGSTLAGLVNGASGSITTVINPLFNNAPTAVVSGSGAWSYLTTGIFSTTGYYVVNGTSWTAGAGAPSGNCIGSTGIYTNSTAVDASHVLYVCQANAYTAVTVP